MFMQLTPIYSFKIFVKTKPYFLNNILTVGYELNILKDLCVVCWNFTSQLNEAVKLGSQTTLPLEKRIARVSGDPT